MANDGNLRRSQRAHQLDARALNLDCFGAGFLHEPHGVGHPVSNRPVIAAERHVGHHQRAMHGAAYGARVVQHLVHGDGQRVFVAEHDHGQRVADKNQIDPSLVHQRARWSSRTR